VKEENGSVANELKIAMDADDKQQRPVMNGKNVGHDSLLAHSVQLPISIED